MFDEQKAEQIVEQVQQGKSLRASARQFGDNPQYVPDVAR